MPVTSKDIDFQHHMLSFFVHWVKMRGDCSFCWYWWNWLPSLFNFSVHNHGSMILLNSWPWPHDYIHFLVFMHNAWITVFGLFKNHMWHNVIPVMSPDDFIYTKYSTHSMNRVVRHRPCKDKQDITYILYLCVHLFYSS